MTTSKRHFAQLAARPATLLLLAFAVIATAAAPATAAPPATANTTADCVCGVTRLTQWRMQSSSQAQQGGRILSVGDFSTKGWYPVQVPATIMGGLLHDGRYRGVFYSDNLRKVRAPHGEGRFQIPWWYRAVFQISGDRAGLHTFVRFNGIIPSADIWLNGTEIATRKTVAGAYAAHTFDITALVHPGRNVLAVKIYPASPERDLSISWINWNPAPPDNNMGIWRSVELIRTGPVSLRGLHVLSTLDLPRMQQAELTVKARLRNYTGEAETVVLRGEAAGVPLRRTVELAPRASVTVVFDPANTPGLRLDHPRVWWPAGMGAHPLYHATLSASIGSTGEAPSDRESTTFGIRDVTSRLTPQGYRQFVINGQPVLIRGGGWAPDMFLRDRPARLAEEFRYVRNLGLNAIRTEGKLERPGFYDLADREGILILPGWECCSKWEAAAKTGGEPWDERDYEVAGESMASEARALRDHPSVIAFLIGSDNAPPPRTARIYVDALRAADWPDPIISAASDQATRAAGPSGMKMNGPYEWEPPRYWYAGKEGGAFGFNSEASPGRDIPRLSTLQAMLDPRELAALWQDPGVRQFHGSPFWSPREGLKAYDAALANRYGPAKSLRDYVEKAQVADYEAVRAEFEAYNARMDAANPSTGVIYWMLNSAWPSLHWHLIPYDLDPAGAYYGAQEANQPVHIQYSYDDRAVIGVNLTRHAERGLDARIRVYNLDGTVRYHRELSRIDLPANHATRLADIPLLPRLSSAYFVELELTTGNGVRLSRNVYWLSTRPDKLDWAKTTYYATLNSQFADLTALQSLPAAAVAAGARTQRAGDEETSTITVTATPASKAVAFFVHLSIREPGGGKPVLPVRWNTNDVTLWPGESETLTARYAATGKTSPAVRLSGWNVTPQTIAAPVSQEAGAR